MIESINVFQLMQMMLKKWWIILISVIVLGSALYLYSAFVAAEMYTSKGTLFVNNKDADLIQKQSSINVSDLTTSEKLVETYAVILKNDKFMDKISSLTGLGYSGAAIKSFTSTASVKDTQVLSIKVTTGSAYHSRQILQTILNSANDEIKRVTESGSVKIVEDASMPKDPSSPNKKINTIIGVLLGLVLGTIIIILLNVFDVSVKNEEDLEESYNIPVVGVIPHIEAGNEEVLRANE